MNLVSFAIVWQTGAIGAVPAGQGVVEGGAIPYLPEALKKKKDIDRALPRLAVARVRG